MTELNSKWEVAVCLRMLCFLAVAVWLAAAPGKVLGEDDGQAEVTLERTVPAGETSSHSSASIRTNLASVAASAFEPAREGAVDLANFGAKPAAAVLNVPAPGSLSPAPHAEDQIPEPGTIGFGLAVAALIFGNFAKALMRCWKITNSTSIRE